MFNIENFVNGMLLLKTFEMKDGAIAFGAKLPKSILICDHLDVNYRRYNAISFQKGNAFRNIKKSRDYSRFENEVSKRFGLADAAAEEMAIRIVTYVLGMYKTDILIESKPSVQYVTPNFSIFDVIMSICQDTVRFRNDMYSEDIADYASYYSDMFENIIPDKIGSN